MSLPEQILHALAAGPKTAQELAEELGHRDDVIRPCLYQLERQGLVRRQEGDSKGRGRPPILWSLNPEASSPPAPSPDEEVPF